MLARERLRRTKGLQAAECIPADQVVADGGPGFGGHLGRLEIFETGRLTDAEAVGSAGPSPRRQAFTRVRQGMASSYIRNAQRWALV